DLLKTFSIMPKKGCRRLRNFSLLPVAMKTTAPTIDLNNEVMPKKSIVTGILSYGMSGRVFHAPFINQKTRFELRAIVERHEKRAQQRYPDIISYDSVDYLLNDEAIELVIINTPNNTHVDYAIQALNAGKHMLVEKPFAPSSTEADQVFDLGRK